MFLQVYQGSWIRNHDSRNVVNLFVHESYNPVSEVIIGDISVLKVSALFFYIMVLPKKIKIYLFLLVLELRNRFYLITLACLIYSKILRVTI